MGNQQGKDIEQDAAWLGGFIDGEGSFMVTVTTHRGKWGRYLTPAFKLANTDIPTLNVVQAILDALEVAYHVEWRTPTVPRRRRSWMIVVKGMKRTLKFAQALLPYLRTKRSQCEDMIEFCHSRLAQSPSGGKGDWPKYTPRQLMLAGRLRGHAGKHTQFDVSALTDYTPSMEQPYGS